MIPPKIILYILLTVVLNELVFSCDPSNQIMHTCLHVYHEKYFIIVEKAFEQARRFIDESSFSEMCRSFEEMANCYIGFLRQCKSYPYFNYLRRHINSFDNVYQTLCSNITQGVRELIKTGFCVENWRKNDTSCKKLVDNQWPQIIPKMIRFERSVPCRQLKAYGKCFQDNIKDCDRKSIWSKTFFAWIDGLCQDPRYAPRDVWRKLSSQSSSSTKSKIMQLYSNIITFVLSYLLLNIRNL